jgi:transcriptional regulator
MYQPTHHREDRLDIQHQLIREHPLGLLVSNGRSGLIANPVPFVLEPSFGAKGILKAHIARANPQWLDFDPTLEALVVFQGPQAYISPSWYATKKLTGKVVPTWNYASVHAYGLLKIIEDRAWLLDQIQALTAMRETGPRPWSVGDAPPDYVQAMLDAVIGLEIVIGRLEGKWKVSQNRPAADRSSVIEALAASTSEMDRAMARLVKKFEPES